MTARLGARVTLCTAFGGEAGRVMASLLAEEEIEVRATECRHSSGSYVHERRTGNRKAIAEIPESPLTRNELDDLYDATLISGLHDHPMVLTGPQNLGTVPGDVYRRLAADATTNEVAVVSDITGEPLAGALEGGVSLANVSDVELLDEGLAPDDNRDGLIGRMRALQRRGVRTCWLRSEQPIDPPGGTAITGSSQRPSRMTWHIAAQPRRPSSTSPAYRGASADA